MEKFLIKVIPGFIAEILLIKYLAKNCKKTILVTDEEEE